MNWNHSFNILLDSVDNYARQWTPRDREDIDTLSEWIKDVGSLVQSRILKKMCLWAITLSDLHDIYVFVPECKASNNIVFAYSSFFFIIGERIFQDSYHINGYQLCFKFSPTDSFIRMLQTSYRGILRKAKKKLVWSFY